MKVKLNFYENNYFLIEESYEDNRVIFYGNDIETWTAFIASTYNTPYGFYADGDFVSKGDPWLLWGQSGWVNVNNSLINGGLYGWGAN